MLFIAVNKNEKTTTHQPKITFRKIIPKSNTYSLF